MRNAEPGMNSRRALMPLSPYSALGILPSSFNMSRLDQALVERGLCESREKARRAVMAGLVTINRQPARKPSDQVRPHDQVELEAGEKYVSRGGHKLEHAGVVEMDAGEDAVDVRVPERDARLGHRKDRHEIE